MVPSGKKVECAIWYVVNSWSLQVECARMLHEALLVPLLLYSSERIIWREKERSRNRFEQMDRLRGLLGIMRLDTVQ